MTYGNGHYERRAGVWVYAATGEPVPGATDVKLPGRRGLFMQAPEIHPGALLTTDLVVELLGITAAGFRGMVSRGDGPRPVFKYGNQPLWTRPIIDHWLATRPGKGGHNRAA